jgi:hypothetical protein
MFKFIGACTVAWVWVLFVYLIANVTRTFVWKFELWTWECGRKFFLIIFITLILSPATLMDLGGYRDYEAEDSWDHHLAEFAIGLKSDFFFSTVVFIPTFPHPRFIIHSDQPNKENCSLFQSVFYPVLSWAQLSAFIGVPEKKSKHRLIYTLLLHLGIFGPSAVISLVTKGKQNNWLLQVLLFSARSGSWWSWEGSGHCWNVDEDQQQLTGRMAAEISTCSTFF